MGHFLLIFQNFQMLLQCFYTKLNILYIPTCLHLQRQFRTLLGLGLNIISQNKRNKRSYPNCVDPRGFMRIYHWKVQRLDCPQGELFQSFMGSSVLGILFFQLCLDTCIRLFVTFLPCGRKWLQHLHIRERARSSFPQTIRQGSFFHSAWTNVDQLLRARDCSTGERVNYASPSAVHSRLVMFINTCRPSLWEGYAPHPIDIRSGHNLLWLLQYKIPEFNGTM